MGGESTLQNLRPRLDCDVLVIGSGGGALAAAVTAAVMKLTVIVVEKAPWFGGATARSGGWLWLPGNRFSPPGDSEAARLYLQGRAGKHWRPDRVDAFLAAAPRMHEFFETRTELRLFPVKGFWDYSSEDPGAAAGRGLMPEPCDASILGPLRAKLRPPLRVATLLGMMIELPEQATFMKAGRSASAAFFVAKRLTRHALAVLRHGDITRLANGAALIARLLKTATDNGVELHTDAPAMALIPRSGGGVSGAVVTVGGVPTEIHARRGVVVATGGFNHDRKRRDALTPWAAGVPESWDAFPTENSGDGLRMAEEVGGVVCADVASPVALAPLTPLAKPIGNAPMFPQFSGRAKPGLIAVLPNGQRFVDEAKSYHVFGRALIEAWGGKPGAHAWLICDDRSYRRYGLGYAKPWPIPPQIYRRIGYLTSAPSIPALAAKCGIDAAGLAATITAFNADAARSEDRAFGRGSTRYERVLGDAECTPNPCVAPLIEPPFHAVRVIPGAVGTFAGLLTDGRARVLDSQGQPILGLYAAGNDLMSVFGGDYIGGGCTIGPGMVFGYLAALDAADVRENS
jgi:succinate dehydrogenase/fumarate reductase flavoprotein subunit